MKVVLLSPAIFSGSSLLDAAAEAEAEEEAVTRTTVELRDAVTTVVRVMDDREEGEAEEMSSADDSTADGEGEAEAAAASAVDGWMS